MTKEWTTYQVLKAGNSNSNGEPNYVGMSDEEELLRSGEDLSEGEVLVELQQELGIN